MALLDALARKLEDRMPSLRGYIPTGGFRSPVSGIIHESYERARLAQTAERAQQWWELRQALDYNFSDAFKAYLKQIHPERAEDFAEDGYAGNRYLALIPMIASRLAVSFHSPPETYLYRMVDGEEQVLPESDPQVQQWREDYRSARLNLVLPQIDLWQTVLRQCLVMPSRVRNRIVWRVYAPDELVIDQDPHLPEEIEHARQVSIEVRQPVDPSTARLSRTTKRTVDRVWMSWRCDENEATGEEEWSLWFHDDSGHLLQKGGKTWFPLFGSHVNEYGAHPFVLWRAQEPQPGEIFLPPREDWLQAQHGVNENLTDADLGLRMQTHAQGVMNGIPIQGEHPTLGPTRLLVFPDSAKGGDLRYVAPPVDLEELRETLNQKLRALAVAEDLPTDTWEANSSTRNFMAKMVEAFQLIVRQGRVQPAYRHHWDATTRVHMMVGNHWASELGRVRYDDGVRVGIRFAPLPWPQDRYQEAQTAELEYRQGRRDPVEDIMRTEGVSRATAERLHGERKDRAPEEPAPQPPNLNDPTKVGAGQTAANDDEE